MNIKILYIIPARGGSKGIHFKNIKPLNGKPLIGYTIETAKEVCDNLNQICISTDNQEIASIAKKFGIDIPFIRPAELATDNANSRDVILHALKFYKEHKNEEFDAVILLQPTSPFRKSFHIHELVALFKPELDMVVSVKESHENPYFTIYEEDTNGYLVQSKEIGATRRQDCPAVYVMNGSIYMISVKSILQKSFAEFKNVKKYLMEDKYSLDIDTELDWLFCETLLKNHIV